MAIVALTNNNRLTVSSVRTPSILSVQSLVNDVIAACARWQWGIEILGVGEQLSSMLADYLRLDLPDVPTCALKRVVVCV